MPVWSLQCCLQVFLVPLLREWMVALGCVSDDQTTLQRHLQVRHAGVAQACGLAHHVAAQCDGASSSRYYTVRLHSLLLTAVPAHLVIAAAIPNILTFLDLTACMVFLIVPEAWWAG